MSVTILFRNRRTLQYVKYPSHLILFERKKLKAKYKQKS